MGIIAYLIPSKVFCNTRSRFTQPKPVVDCNPMSLAHLDIRSMGKRPDSLNQLFRISTHYSSGSKTVLLSAQRPPFDYSRLLICQPTAFVCPPYSITACLPLSASRLRIPVVRRSFTGPSHYCQTHGLVPTLSPRLLGPMALAVSYPDHIRCFNLPSTYSSAAQFCLLYLLCIRSSRC